MGQFSYQSTKTFTGLPCAHRQWRHDGHCKFLHGYDRTVTITFGSDELDERGWVMDFGDLKDVKQWLEDLMDHTCLINEDDPELELFRELDAKGIIQLRVLPSIGMEGTSRHVFDHVDQVVKKKTKGRVRVLRVECRENQKNSGICELA